MFTSRVGGASSLQRNVLQRKVQIKIQTRQQGTNTNGAPQQQLPPPPRSGISPSALVLGSLAVGGGIAAYIYRDAIADAAGLGASPRRTPVAPRLPAAPPTPSPVAAPSPASVPEEAYLSAAAHEVVADREPAPAPPSEVVARQAAAAEKVDSTDELLASAVIAALALADNLPSHKVHDAPPPTPVEVEAEAPAGAASSAPSPPPPAVVPGLPATLSSPLPPAAPTVDAAVASARAASSSALTQGMASLLSAAEAPGSGATAGLSPEQLRDKVHELSTELAGRARAEALRLREFIAKNDEAWAGAWAAQARAAETARAASLAAAVTAAQEAAVASAQEALAAERAALIDEITTSANDQLRHIQQDMLGVVAAETSARLARVDALKAEVAGTDSMLAARSEFERASRRAHQVAVAVDALRAALERPAPATQEVAALIVAGGNDPVLEAAVSLLPPCVHDPLGPPSRARLLAAFPHVASDGRRAAFTPPGLGRVGDVIGLAGASIFLPLDSARRSVVSNLRGVRRWWDNLFAPSPPSDLGSSLHPAIGAAVDKARSSVAGAAASAVTAVGDALPKLEMPSLPSLPSLPPGSDGEQHPIEQVRKKGREGVGGGCPAHPR